MKNLSDRHPHFNSSCFLFRPILPGGSPWHPGRPWPTQLPTAMPATCPSAFVKRPESSPSLPPPPSPITDITQVGPVPVPWSQGFQLQPRELLSQLLSSQPPRQECPLLTLPPRTPGDRAGVPSELLTQPCTALRPPGHGARGAALPAPALQINETLQMNALRGTREVSGFP